MNEDLANSHSKLNAKYKDVLLENEDLRDTNEKVSGLLEQSQMEIEKLNEETDTLQNQVNTYKKKVDELEKKANEHPVKVARGHQEDGWTYYRLTYYDNDEQSTGKNPGDKGYGITASGRHTQTGVTIAVDSDIIPLGTWVLIKWPDGRIEKRRADDTGSAINGYDIDYYVPHATLSMGAPMVGVKILGNE
jgi:3D (Asp-Asp-Asp) domain-containing protein